MPRTSADSRKVTFPVPDWENTIGSRSSRTDRAHIPLLLAYLMAPYSLMVICTCAATTKIYRAIIPKKTVIISTMVPPPDQADFNKVTSL